MVNLTKDEILNRYEFGPELFDRVVSRLCVRPHTRFGTPDGILEQLAEIPVDGKPLTVFYMCESPSRGLQVEKMFFTKKLESD